MQKQDSRLLLFLALKSGLHGKARTSTAKIASAIGASQQTASRKMRSLEKQGLIELSATPSGCTFSLTGQGIESLRSELSQLQQLFGGKAEKGLRGKVKDGLGEGKYYISRPAYMKQFREKLGFKPFLGTLNLIVSMPELRAFLSGKTPVEIEGFRTEERSFGRIKAFPVLFQGERAAIIFPERTAHPENEIEVISATNLRKKYRLKQGSKALLKAI